MKDKLYRSREKCWAHQLTECIVQVDAAGGISEHYPVGTYVVTDSTGTYYMSADRFRTLWEEDESA